MVKALVNALGAVDLTGLARLSAFGQCGNNVDSSTVWGDACVENTVVDSDNIANNILNIACM